MNLKKLSTHLILFSFSLVGVFIVLSIHSGSKNWSTYIHGFILAFIQLELFIALANIIFKNIKTGSTPKEITKVFLLRFAFFMISCFIAALIIYISFLYIKQFSTGAELKKVLPDFLNYGFASWFKATTGGLLLGAIIFIVALWQDALKREQKLREENLIFQNETLKNQINPHFLFNSLNTLSSLIATQPGTADRFISKLSSIYRYILENSRKDKVPLPAELVFIREYFELHQIRDEEKISLTINTTDAERFMILPVSLQILVENAIKHNMATREKPLNISIFIENQHIVVENNLQKMMIHSKSTKTGLKNLAERIRLITGRELIIEETQTNFIVKVPLLS